MISGDWTRGLCETIFAVFTIGGLLVFSTMTTAAYSAVNEKTPRPMVVAAQQTVDSELVRQGKKLAKRSGCAACHSLDGKRRPGPTWKGLFGRTRILVGGTEVVADEAYLRRAIVSPNADVVKGFPMDLMPGDYGQKLSEEKIRAIIELVKSLQ